MSHQGLLIGQTQAKAHGKKSTDGVHTVQNPGQGGGWRWTWRSKRKVFPSTTVTPLTEKAMQSPFLTAAFAPHSIKPFGKKSIMKSPKNTRLAQQSFSWCPSPHPRASPQEAHEAGSCHSGMSHFDPRGASWHSGLCLALGSTLLLRLLPQVRVLANQAHAVRPR